MRRNPDDTPITFVLAEPEPTFEEALQGWRHRTGFTQAQTAALLRVSLSTYQGWEQGRPCPTAYAVIVALYALIDDRPHTQEQTDGAPSSI